MPEKYNSEINGAGAGDDVEVSFNPLDEAVNEKSYTNAAVNVSGIDLTAPIPEARFTPPPIEAKKPPVPQQEKKPIEPVNNEFTTLSKKETRAAAEHAADMAINVYEWLHQLGNKALQVSERKLAKMQADGELNLHVMIEYDMGKVMPAGEFINEYNMQVSNMLVVSDEFKEEVRPLLIEVFTKRGIGLTVEQRLAFVVAKDVGTKLFMFAQQKSIVNQMLSHMRDATTAANAQAAPKPAPQPQPTPPPPVNDTTYQQQPVQGDTVVPNSNEVSEPEERRKRYESAGQTGQAGQVTVVKRRAGRPRKTE